MILTERNREILEHYQRFWGHPGKILEVDVREHIDSSLIYIAEFPPNSEEEDWVYATIGTYNVNSPNRSEVRAESSRLEFFLYSNLQNSEITKLLASLYIYPVVNKTFFSVGDTVRGETPILYGSGLTDVLLTYPYFEEKEFGVIHHSNNTHTFMIWLVPLYPTERQYIQKSSWDALEELFRKGSTDTSDFFRKPVV